MQFDDVNVGGQLTVGTGVCAAVNQDDRQLMGLY